MKKSLWIAYALLAIAIVWTDSLLAAQATAQERDEQLLINGGFELKLEGWSTHVYGATPRIEPDSEVKHGGSQSLKISSDQPCDAALGQEIQLHPKQWYRFTGWTRTARLKPNDAAVHGTFQIQFPGGRGVLASGANHRDNTDWTQVTIVFRAPADGRARVAPFFVGYGKGVGTAWFDDLSIEPIDIGGVPLRVLPERLNSAPISKYQYGQFIEYLCDSVPAMWAEKIYDGGFEGLSPYKVVYLKETDFREKPWRPSGATNRAKFLTNKTDRVGGKLAREINATGDTPCLVGVSQDGVAIAAGEPCLFSCYLRQEGIAAPVEVMLHHEQTSYATAKFEAGGEWKKFTARLVPEKTDDAATLTIRFTGPGKLLIDNVSLMPEKTVGGWRTDAVEALRAMRPGIIRFGGSALDVPEYGDFEWRTTLGDPDHRGVLRSWGGLQPTGPGLEEIVQLCYEVSAEPLICVRTFKRPPQDAADEVEYFNGSPDTPMGKLRAQNGHPAPYGIKFWQIGNERGGPEYEAQIAPFAEAMRKVDPSIKLMASFPSEGVLKNGAGMIDYVCPHQYDCANLSGVEAELLATRDMIQRIAPGKNIKLGVTEWNTTAGDFGPSRASLWNLHNALAVARYHNLLHRHSDLVEIANRSNLSNSFCSGVIQTDNHRLYKTPAYYAQQLYATLAGSRPLKIDSKLPADATIDVSATLSDDGATLTLFAINDSDEPIERPIDVSAFAGREPELSVWTLADRDAAGQPDVVNDFGDPERVASQRTALVSRSGVVKRRFAPYSLTVLQWRIKAAQ